MGRIGVPNLFKLKGLKYKEEKTGAGQEHDPSGFKIKAQNGGIGPSSVPY